MTASHWFNCKDPYVLKALKSWMEDVGLTPNIKFRSTNPEVRIPEHLKDSEIIALNIGRDACRNFVIDDDFIGFDTRFSGDLFSITVPITEITEIYAKEQSAGALIIWPDTIKFYFDGAVQNLKTDVLKDDLKGKLKQKPDLKLIK